MWDEKLPDSFEVFSDLIPSLVLIGDIVSPPTEYCISDHGVQLVCKYLKHYGAETLDSFLYDGKQFTTTWHQSLGKAG